MEHGQQQGELFSRFDWVAEMILDCQVKLNVAEQLMEQFLELGAVDVE